MKKKFNFKKIKIKNFPRFILIATILLIIILIASYYIFMYYSPKTVIQYGGYGVEPKTIAENLKNGNEEKIEEIIEMVKVEEQDILFKKLNTYFIGGAKKRKIDINYPIYINDNQALLNLGENTKLITVNYEEVEGYPDFTIAGGIMYNGDDLTRADENEYIFLKNEEEIYTNLKEIKIKTSNNEYTIAENSNMNITKEEIRYYEIKGEYLEYKKIEDIDLDSKVEINGENISYEEFLKRLKILEEEQEEIEESKENEENKVEESQNKEEDKTDNNLNNTNNINSNINSNTVEGNVVEGIVEEGEKEPAEWIKPEVSCREFEAEVYTMTTELNINDPSGVVESVQFEIEREGKLYRRVQVGSGGKLQITGLGPETKYKIKGIYKYKTEEGREVEEVFYEGEVETKGIKTLGTIRLSYENGEIYSNKIELDKLKIENETTEEVVKGISRIEIEIDGVTYKLKSSEISSIAKGEEIKYQSSENIESNKKIKYKIRIYDRYGNELKVENGEGETRTSKAKPSVRLSIKEQDITIVKMNLNLSNKDKVELKEYKYKITSSNGDLVQENNLKEEEKELEIKNLNPNDYYTIKIYANYDLEDNKGEQKEQIIGQTTFTTLPLSSLGYLALDLEKEGLTQTQIDLGVEIDEQRTDIRLIQIIKEIKIKITPLKENKKGEEVEDKEKKSYEKTLEEEIKELKVGEKVSIKFDKLESNTKYRIDVTAKIQQGEIIEEVECTYNLNNITTLKKSAEVQIRNQFVIGDMVDFDVRIKDVDGASLTNKVRIELRNEHEELVEIEEIETNKEYERKTYSGLEENKTYKLYFYAPQYNEGSDDSTYKSEYLLKEIDIVTEPGISGSIGLEALERKGTGKNLVDVSSKVNWYERCFGIGEQSYGLNYDENTKILTMGGTSGYTRLTYYDLSKFLGEEVTISFKARKVDDTYIQIIEKSNDDFTNNNFKSYNTINNLTNEWQEYSYTVNLSQTGYIGFRVNDDNKKVEIKDLQIEEGSRKTLYEDFKYIQNAKININLKDLKDEITTNDYYVRIYKDNKQIEEVRYEEIGEENKIENAKKEYEIGENGTYKIELLVKIRDRYYTLDSEEFETEKGKEIKGISTLNDFLKIQPYGEYIVLEDLDFSGVGANTYTFGHNDTMRFAGKVDFNGKNITIYQKQLVGLFNANDKNGVLENIVINVKLNQETETSNFRSFVGNNYGTIRNIQINLIESAKVPNNTVGLLCVNNNSTRNYRKFRY